MMTTRENWKKYEKTYFMPPDTLLRLGKKRLC